MSSAAGSLFARVYAGHTGVDPYTTAVSDTYQDLFGEGIFTGKGLYDVDAFTAALEGRVPENALLSHDLFEGLYARTALVSRRRGRGRLSRRACSPTRAGSTAGCAATGRSCSGCCRCVPTPHGPRAQPAAAHQPLEDPRQPAAQPRGAGAAGAAGSRPGPWLPGSPLGWTLAALGGPRRSRSARRCCTLLARAAAAAAARRVPARRVARTLRDRAAQVAARSSRCSPTTPGDAARHRAHAGAAGRHAAAAARMGDAPRPPRAPAGLHGGAACALFLRRDVRPSPASRGLRRCSIARRAARARCRSALPVPAAVAASRRSIACWLSRPVAPRAARTLDAEDARSCGASRGRRGATSRRSSAAEDHWLPPDNFQEVPDAARRAPHVADQHRHGPARRRSPRTTSASSTPPTLVGPRRAHARDARGPRASRGPPAQLVRHATLAPLLPALRLDRRQRQPGRRADGARRGAARRCAGRDREPGARRGDRGHRAAARAKPGDARARRERAATCATLARRVARSWSALARARRASRRVRPRDGEVARALLEQPRATLARPSTRPADAAAAAVADWARRAAAGARAAPREPRRDAGRSSARRRRSPRRADALADGDELPLPLRPRAPDLLDRLPARRRRGPGRLDPSYYDLLASEARLASFIAIAKGDVPQEHWFQLGRALVERRRHRRRWCRGAARCSST